ncbi:hypothetical protein QFC24_004659 [Naganishia onofrii]|uniref:Uncharacterized protein n=1 Tax=Naganishia onofrii TaxID=1851511 RepID=A0ACC2XCE8_9TREE|nr:hypothetical protein QFC24_004659 [Naganishia onofrii]
MPSSSVSSSSANSETTAATTIVDDEEEGQRALARTAIYLNEITLDVQRSASTRDDVSIAETAVEVSATETAASRNSMETVASGSTTEATTASLFRLGLTVSEWVPGSEGDEGQIRQTILKRQFDIDKPGDLEEQFGVMVQQLNPQGKPMPRVEGQLEHTMGLLNGEAIESRKKALESLRSALIQTLANPDTSTDIKEMSVEKLANDLASATNEDLELSPGSLATALFHLRRARALRQIVGLLTPNDDAQALKELLRDLIAKENCAELIQFWEKRR